MAGAAVGLRMAPWGRRVGAALLDVVPLVVLSSLLLLAGGARPDWLFGQHHHVTGGQLAVRYAAALVAAVLYFPPLMRLTDGRTLGKIALGIRVVRISIGPRAWALPRYSIEVPHGQA